MAGAGIVTLLFTDVVGSTELLDRLGDVAAEQVRRAHFALLREALAERGGEEVKNLGDGLMVVFPSATDAVASVVAMQRAVARHNRSAADDTRLEVRVGLHVGEPIRDEDDFFGTPVVVAKRLCDRATGGQILASALVRELVALCGEHDFSPLGALELKGLSEPIVTFEVAWPAEPVGAGLELPVSLVAGEATGFVARDSELGRLVEAWAAARKGEGKLVVVSGEPGVGKTRLCAELARAAHIDGAAVLHGRCYEEGVVPYQPFIEALGPFVRACGADELRAAAPIGLPELALVMPELATAFPPTESLNPEPEAERYRLFEAVGSVLEHAAASCGALLVLDDLHWADKPTLVLLQHLLRKVSSRPAEVVGTYRDTELAPTHPLADMLATLRREDAVTRVPLRGLDEVGVAALLRAWAGHDPPPQFARAVFEETEGNPFFVNEVVQHLAETGAIYQRDGEWVSDLDVDQLGIPEGVREVVGRRLARLGDDAFPVLTAAAIAGRDFDAAIVAQASGVDEGAALDALDYATSGGLVHEVSGVVGRYAFSHALVQETLRHQVGTAKRAFLHRKIGEAVEARYAADLDAHLAELAFHFGEAAAGESAAKAVDYASRAGDRAQRQLAYEDAASMFERALQALELSGTDDPARRSELLQRRGTALGWSGQNQAAWAAFDEAAELARAVGDPELLARAAAEYADFPDFTPDRSEGALARLEEALAALPPGDSFLRARLLVLLGFTEQFVPHRREGRGVSLREGLAMARRVGAPVVQAAALNFLRGASGPEERGEDFELQREALALALEAKDVEYELVARMGLIDLLLSVGRLGEAREQLALGAAALAAAGGHMLSGSMVLGHQIMFELLEGHFAVAEELIERLLERGGGLDNNVTAISYSVAISRVRGEQGRLAELEPLVRRMVDTTQAPGFRARLGAMFVELGRLDEAREQLELLGAMDLEAERTSPVWLVTAAYLSELARAFDATELATALRPLVEPWAGRAILVVGVACNGSVDRNLALLSATLGELDAAEAQFESALAMNRDQLESPPLAARVQVDYAAMLLERDGPGDREHARALLDDAVATTDELQMLVLGGRAHRLRAEIS